MKLPIDTVPNTSPTRFRWRQTVESPVGRRTVECEGGLPTSVEEAVKQLIGIAKQQDGDIARLLIINQGFADRIAAQSEILSKNAEKKTEAPQQVSSIKKGKGG